MAIDFHHCAKSTTVPEANIVAIRISFVCRRQRSSPLRHSSRHFSRSKIPPACDRAGRTGGQQWPLAGRSGSWWRHCPELTRGGQQAPRWSWNASCRGVWHSNFAETGHSNFAATTFCCH